MWRFALPLTVPDATPPQAEWAAEVAKSHRLNLTVDWWRWVSLYLGCTVLFTLSVLGVAIG